MKTLEPQDCSKCIAKCSMKGQEATIECDKFQDTVDYFVSEHPQSGDDDFPIY